MSLTEAQLAVRSNHGRKGARSRRSGWHRIDAWKKSGVMLEPHAPSAWENLLRELEIADGRALAEIEARTEKGEQLRRFIDRKCKWRYVPEAVLLALGMAREAEEAVARCDLRGVLRLKTVAGHPPDGRRQ